MLFFVESQLLLVGQPTFHHLSGQTHLSSLYALVGIPTMDDNPQ